MSLPVIVLGAGGHAKVLINTLQLCSVEILGVTDPDSSLIGKEVLGVPIIGSDNALLNYSAQNIELVNGLGSIGLPVKRQQLFDKFKSLGFTYATVMHPSAVIASDVEIGEGSQVMAGAVIQPCSRIGINCVINTRASVDHDCTIDDHVHIAPGVTLSGRITVGKRSHIGTGATVIQGITVGKSCLVAAGAVVTKDILDGLIVRGVPAREIK